MRRLMLLLGLFLLLYGTGPTSAYAHHSLVGGADCGTRVADDVGEMTKGRTDSMLITVDHTVGCKHVIVRNIVGTGLDESHGYAGQETNCVKYGRDEAVNIFRYYFDTEVDRESIAVKCSRYNGPD